MAAPELNGRRITSREQAAAEALVLQRERGYGVRAIAEELTARGWQTSKTTAAELVQEARRAEPFIELLDRAEARRDQAERLRTYHQILFDDLHGGRITGREFVGDMRWIEERWAKLAGLDAPKQIEIDDRREPPKYDDLVVMRDALAAAVLRGREEEAEVLRGEIKATEQSEQELASMSVHDRHEELHRERGDDNPCAPPCVEYGCVLFRQALRETYGD